VTAAGTLAPRVSQLTFVQLEFPWRLGPADGRYLVRSAPERDPDHIVALEGTEREARRAWIQWWQSPGPRTMVRLSRVTVIDTRPKDAERANAWLSEAEDGRASETVREAIAVVNRVLRAQRAAAVDPSVHDVRAEQTVRIMVGYGSPDAVSTGQASKTAELPRGVELDAVRRAARLRTEGLDPSTRFARLLSGGDYPLMCEELLLRARSDLDNGRHGAATLMTHLALEAVSAELSDDPDVSRDDLEQIASWRDTVGAAAEPALEDTVPGDVLVGLGGALDDVEQLLRRRLVSRAS